MTWTALTWIDGLRPGFGAGFAWVAWPPHDLDRFDLG